MHTLFDSLEFRVLRDRLFETLESEEEIDGTGFELDGVRLGEGEVAGWLAENARDGRVGMQPEGSWGHGSGEITGLALATGTGVLRIEQLGPLLAGQLSELLGHDRVIVKPVIDLHDQVSVDSYEIPDRIRERVRLRHPVDMFPYGAAEATPRTDLDHIVPYDRTGPPGHGHPAALRQGAITCRPKRSISSRWGEN